MAAGGGGEEVVDIVVVGWRGGNMVIGLRLQWEMGILVLIYYVVYAVAGEDILAVFNALTLALDVVVSSVLRKVWGVCEERGCKPCAPRVVTGQNQDKGNYHASTLLPT